eukprot:gene7273-7486_t
MQAGDVVILKDLYGFEINTDYAELLQTYSPIWIASEAASERSWRLFLSTTAEELGLRTPGEAVTHSGEAFGFLCSDVLQQLAEQQAPKKLIELVHGGIPNSLRQHAWPVFLRARDRCPCSQYAKLAVLGLLHLFGAAFMSSDDGIDAALLLQRCICLSSAAVFYMALLDAGSSGAWLQVVCFVGRSTAAAAAAAAEWMQVAAASCIPHYSSINM